MKELLRRYVEVRLQLQARGESSRHVAVGLEAGAALQQELWRHTEAAVREAPSPIAPPAPS